MDVILNINNLKYDSLFQDISIYIEKNTITAISGPNNCGKTTLFKILSRAIKIKENIILDGKEIYEYSDYEYDKIVQTVFSTETIFHENTIIDELYFQDKNADKEKINFIISGLNLNKIKNKNISKLSEKEKMLTQIAKAILNSNSIVLIDEIDYYFTKDELIILYESFYQFIKKYNMTFLITCLNLDSLINIDHLYIIKDGKIVLKGNPLQVLSKDNIINKIGLEVPFMIDLSIKLRDYQLVDKIILNQDEMIGELWK